MGLECIVWVFVGLELGDSGFLKFSIFGFYGSEEFTIFWVVFFVK